MILNVILALVVVTAVASTINLFDKRVKPVGSVSLVKQMPGNLPIIALSNNGTIFNFILDSGSNISHICEECYELINSELIGTYKEGEVSGLGDTIKGVTMCRAAFKDVMGHEYSINLSISSHLSEVAKSIEAATGVQVHGLLGTDFLREYNYVLDFKALEVYPQK